MKNFLNQMWVKVVCVIFIILGAGVLIYDGVTVEELSNLIKLVAGVLTAIALLVGGGMCAHCYRIYYGWEGSRTLQ